MFGTPTARHLASYFSFSMATGLMNFAAVLVLTRFIPPAEYGRIGIFFSLLYFAAPLVSLSAENLIAVKKAELAAPDYEAFKQGYISLSYAVFAAVQALVVLAYPLGLLADPLYAAVPLFALLRFLAGIVALEYVLEEKPVHFGLLSFLTSVGGLLLTLALVFAVAETAGSRIAAMMLAESLVLLVRYRGRLGLLLSFAPSAAVSRTVVRFGLPLLVSLAAAWALNESDKLIVARLIDVPTAGLYTAACAVGSVMIVFNQSLVNALVPRLYRELRAAPAETMRLVRRYMALFLAAAAAFAVLFVATYALAAEFVLPERYAAARGLVYVVIAWSLANAVYRPLGLAADFFGMTVVRSAGFFVGGALAVAVGAWGVLNHGVQWAAIGVGVGHLALSATLWRGLARRNFQGR